MGDVPLEGLKAKMSKKWSGNGFGPSQMACPKSGPKVPKKLSKRVPAKSGAIQILVLLWLLTNREPKMGAAAEGRRAHSRVAAEGRHLYLSKAQAKLVFLWSQILLGPFLTTFWLLFDNFLGMSFRKAQNHSRTTF